MSGEAGRGSASPESGSCALTRWRVRCSRRPEKRAWQACGWFSGSGALVGDLLQALLAVWEKDVAEKVIGGECFLTMIRPIGKSFPGIDDTGKLERIRFSPLALRTGTDGRNERWPEREMVGLRDGQRDLAGMNDGLNKRRPEGIRVSENWL